MYHGEAIATQVTAWSTAVLTVVGIATLIDLAWARWQQRKTVGLQIGRRAFRARNMMQEWLISPKLNTNDNLTYWIEDVGKGLATVESLLEEMIDLAVGASQDVQKAARHAYRHFMRGANFANKHGRVPHPTGNSNPRDQAISAKLEFERAVKHLEPTIPTDLHTEPLDRTRPQP